MLYRKVFLDSSIYCAIAIAISVALCYLYFFGNCIRLYWKNRNRTPAEIIGNIPVCGAYN